MTGLAISPWTISAQTVAEASLSSTSYNIVLHAIVTKSSLMIVTVAEFGLMSTAVLDVDSMTEKVSFLSTTLSSKIEMDAQSSPSAPVRERVVDVKETKSFPAKYEQ